MLIVLRLVILSVLVFGIGSPVYFYKRHRKLIEPERRVPVVAYILGVIICGGVAGFLGVALGTGWACSGLNASNVCGLTGVFVIGTIACILAMFLVGLSLSLIRPAK